VMSSCSRTDERRRNGASGGRAGSEAAGRHARGRPRPVSARSARRTPVRGERRSLLRRHRQLELRPLAHDLNDARMREAGSLADVAIGLAGFAGSQDRARRVAGASIPEADVLGQRA
jgi:hypothetical protein